MLCGISNCFRLLFRTLRQITHALLTRPPLPVLLQTVRLECVKHAASVHPEPGSNSLKNSISTEKRKFFPLPGSYHFLELFSSFYYFCLSFFFQSSLTRSSHFSVFFFSSSCCSIFNERILPWFMVGFFVAFLKSACLLYPFFLHLSRGFDKKIKIFPDFCIYVNKGRENLRETVKYHKKLFGRAWHWQSVVL